MVKLCKKIFGSRKEYIGDSLELDSQCDCKESIEFESLLSFLGYGDHVFVKRNSVNLNMKELNAIVYFDFLLDEDTELPSVIIGTKFTNQNNEVLFDFVVDRYGDGCINSHFANERRRKKIGIAISFCDYYLNKLERRNSLDLKVNKIIKSALPIPGLSDIEGYSLKEI